MHTSLGKLLDFITRPDIEMHDELSLDDEVALQSRMRLIETLSEPIAHYVVDAALVKLVFDSKQAARISKSACAMIKAGIKHLPFDPIMIEFDIPVVEGDRCRAYVRLQSKPIYPASRWNAVFEDEQADFAAYVICTKPYHDGIDRGDKDAVLIATIDMKSPLPVVLREDSEDNPFWIIYGKSGMAGIDEDLSLAAVIAMHIALLLLNTRGIISERVDTSKLNKARAKGGKRNLPLNPYHVVRVGHVYDASGRAHDVKGSGRTMPVHWRAGHIRNVRYGPYSEPAKHRPKWIEPCLVNYDEGDAPMPKKEVKL